MDRWAERAEALATCGGDGAWIFSACRPYYGMSTAEINKYVWWSPTPDRDTLLWDFAQRLAGAPAAEKLRAAWRNASLAVEDSPELPSYYTGPYYLGPMHPMCANPRAPLPEVFYGQYLFHAEIKDSEGLKKEPTFITSPTGNVPIWGRAYERMKKQLALAASDVRAAQPLVDERHRLTFDAEAGPILWFYHTARTHSNFYESCQLRDAVLPMVNKPTISAVDRATATQKLERWKEVLEDELTNTREAAPLLKNDMRLDPYYGGDHTFSHGEQMIETKAAILQSEISQYLPSLAAKLAKTN
jgi:hypothetical protein